MPILLFPRASTSCPAGYDYHTCNNSKSKFVGCCRLGAPEPCDNGCALEDQPPDSSSSSIVESSNTTPAAAATSTIITEVTSLVTTTVRPTPAPAAASSTTGTKPTTTPAALPSSTNKPQSIPVAGGPTIATAAGQPTPQPSGTLSAPSYSFSDNSSTNSAVQTTPNSSSPSPTQTPDATPSQHTSQAAVIGGVLGASILALAFILLLFWLRKRKQKHKATIHQATPYISEKGKSGDYPSTSSPQGFLSKKQLSPTSTTSNQKQGSPQTAGVPTSSELPAYQDAVVLKCEPDPVPHLDGKQLAPQNELPGAIPMAAPLPMHFELPSVPASPVSKSSTTGAFGHQARKSDPNNPHAMSWATFDSGTSSAKTAAGAGTRGKSEDATINADKRSDNIARLSAPNVGPAWNKMKGVYQRPGAAVSTPTITVTSA